MTNRISIDFFNFVIKLVIIIQLSYVSRINYVCVHVKIFIRNGEYKSVSDRTPKLSFPLPTKYVLFDRIGLTTGLTIRRIEDISRVFISPHSYYVTATRIECVHGDISIFPQ